MYFQHKKQTTFDTILIGIRQKFSTDSPPHMANQPSSLLRLPIYLALAWPVLFMPPRGVRLLA